jgi:hypothetical protein
MGLLVCSKFEFVFIFAYTLLLLFAYKLHAALLQVQNLVQVYSPVISRPLKYKRAENHMTMFDYRKVCFLLGKIYHLVLNFYKKFS